MATATLKALMTLILVILRRLAQVRPRLSLILKA
jgi:hypothetical protein